MRVQPLTLAVQLAALLACIDAKTWTFQDATLSVSDKGSSDAGVKEQLNPKSALSAPVTLSNDATLTLTLTTAEDKTAKRPHQAHLLLQDVASGLEDTYPLTVRETGKAKVVVSFKDLPVQFLEASSPLKATLLLASFGATAPGEYHVFDLAVRPDESVPLRLPAKPLRYGKLDEIRHVFRADPQSPPVIVTLVFLAMIAITVPALLGVWLDVGVNLNHLPEAFNAAPVSHAVFLASLASLEGIFFLYYKDWKLYQMLPAACGAGLVALFSGSRALSEVQSRRLLGKR